jgi:peptidoglycan/LPS O-acetylase OafA/YrhL
VDNVRFLSMLAIVAIHSSAAFALSGKTLDRLPQITVTPWKFATINFFLISGFLLGGRIETCSPLDYLRRRMRRVVGPWLWWGVLLTIAQFAREFSMHVTPSAFAVLGHALVFCLTSTAFWFVPNIMVALTILLLFRRRLHSLRLGATLFAVSLFYAINIYTEWIPSGHTTAIFGFVFYLWLGAFTSLHYPAISAWVARLRIELVIAGVLLTGLAAFAEARLIQRVTSSDPLNSLRFTNQLFSIAVFLLVARFNRAIWPRFVNVRLHTFGIYLAHSLILMIILKTLKVFSVHLPATLFSTPMGVVLLWAGVSTATYLLSLSITKIATQRQALQWMVGADSSRNLPAAPRMRAHQINGHSSKARTPILTKQATEY